MELTQTLQKERIVTRDFLLLCTANFFIFFGFQMTLPTIPIFVKELGGSDQLVGMVVGIFALSALVARAFVGKILETKGRKIVFVFGLCLFVLTIGSYAIIESIVLLFLFRVLQGIGFACSGTAAGTVASDLIPASRRGEGMSLYALGANFALAIAPMIALTLAEVIPVHLIFLFCALSGVIALVLTLQIKYKKIDPIAAQTLQSQKRVFFEKAAWKPSLLMIFITFTFGGMASFLPLYTDEKGIAGIKLFFTVYAISLLATRFFAGKIYDRKGIKYIFVPGAILIMAAMLLLAWLPNEFVLLLAAALYGLGFGSVQPGLQAWAISLVSPNRRGLATATFFAAFDLGVGLGAVLFGQISHYFGYQKIYEASLVSIFISLILFHYFTRDSKVELVK